MNRVFYLIPVLVLAVIGGLFVAGLLNPSGNDLPSALVGREMPALPDGGLEGYETGDIAAIVAENPVTLVNYFASWCGPCRAEHPQLIALADAGVPIIGVNYKDQPDNAQEFMEELGNPYAAIRVDDSGRAAIDWGVSGVPETFFIGRDGEILRRHTGPITQAQLEEIFLPFIAEQN